MTTVTYKKLLLLAALPALMLASCSREELDGGDDGSRTPVAFTAVVQSAALPQLTDTGGSSPATRTALGPDGNTEWTDGDAVSIFMLTSGGTLPDGIIPGGDNVIHNVDPASGALTPAGGTPMYYPGNTAVDFIAWHNPTGHDVDEYYYLKFDVSDQTTVEKQLALDPLYSDNAKGISRGKTPVALQFRHLMSKVRFDITLGVGLTNGNLAEVKLTEAIHEGSFDMCNGSLSSHQPSFSPIIALKSAVPSEGADATYTALLFPLEATYIKRETIVVTVNGKEYTGTLPVTGDREANTMYTYPVTVRETGVEVGIPTTDVPWTEGELPTVTLGNKTFRLIRNAGDLKRFADDVNNGQRDLNALQTADIDLSGIVDNWEPINQAFPAGTEFFTGIYNGNGYTISHLKISSVTGSYAGLFGLIGGDALLTGIHLREVEINLSDGLLVGALVGGVGGGATVSLCSAQGKINMSMTTGTSTGGLAGTNKGIITRCRTDVTVMADGTLAGELLAQAGGITGFNGDGGLLFACHATGNVTLTGKHKSTPGSNSLNAGGITGYNQGNPSFSANIYCCIAEGAVSVTSETAGVSARAGGLAGFHMRGTISNSYACGNATAKETGTSGTGMAGAIVGNKSDIGATISNCYGTGEIGKGTSNVSVNKTNYLVYNTSPGPDDIYNIVTPGTLSAIPFTSYDPSATPAYGMTVAKYDVSINNFWKTGNGKWPVLDFTRNN